MADREEMILKALDGELTPEEEAEFERLLEEDEELREEYHALKGLARGLSSMERVEPPPSVKEGVMARLPRARLRDFFFRPLFTLTPATAALALILFAGALLIRPGGDVVQKTAEQPAAEEVLVRFSIKEPEAESVTLVGSFNSWQEEGIPLSDIEGDGSWSATVPLTPGVHEYLFVVDGKRWVVDPGADFVKDDGFGRKNGVLEI